MEIIWWAADKQISHSNKSSKNIRAHWVIKSFNTKLLQPLLENRIIEFSTMVHSTQITLTCPKTFFYKGLKIVVSQPFIKIQNFQALENIMQKNTLMQKEKSISCRTLLLIHSSKLQWEAKNVAVSAQMLYWGKSGGFGLTTCVDERLIYERGSPAQKTNCGVNPVGVHCLCPVIWYCRVLLGIAWYCLYCNL